MARRHAILGAVSVEHPVLTISWAIDRDGAREELGHNDLTVAGLQNMLDLIFTSGGGTRLSTGNARIGVGDSTSPFSTSHTDLQASTNKLRKGMVAGYPARAAQTVTLQAQFGSSEANFAWNEWGLFWGASGANMLSRKVQPLGTKASPAVWVLTATVTLS